MLSLFRVSFAWKLMLIFIRENAVQKNAYISNVKTMTRLCWKTIWKWHFRFSQFDLDTFHFNNTNEWGYFQCWILFSDSTMRYHFQDLSNACVVLFIEYANEKSTVDLSICLSIHFAHSMFSLNAYIIYIHLYEMYLHTSNLLFFLCSRLILYLYFFFRFHFISFSLQQSTVNLLPGGDGGGYKNIYIYIHKSMVCVQNLVAYLFGVKISSVNCPQVQKRLFQSLRV